MIRRARHASPVVAALAAMLVGTATQAATVALVIDDLGYNRDRARRALALPPPVTAAVLPDAPYTPQIARAAERAGISLLVHMPMQGNEDNMHAGFLRTGMSREHFRQRVRQGLARVPGAIGVNNHMGSVLTTDRDAMDRLMHELRAAPTPLLFLDSRTTADSVAFDAADRAGVATTRRDVFLDNDLDPAAIERQFQHWLRKAHATGCALAIAHPHPETLVVLERLLPHMKGVRRVGIAEYVRVCGRPATPKPAQVATRAEDPPGRRQR
ncbi:MAG: divergent polysaccharide deacetylase family protein [Halofilum sp. (in: g-proteobacteria)]|nr:divergent polysaccharide deacetylase family protein [Halofilum sp. (in: g-proteobacteria)]